MKKVTFFLLLCFLSVLTESFASDPREKGQRYFSIKTGASEDRKRGRIKFLQFNRSEYVLDGLALNLGGIFGLYDSKDFSDGAYLGPQVGASWHFLRTRRFSFCLEGSVGAAFHQPRPAPGVLWFNFDLQAGVGFDYRIAEGAMFQAGLGWHHLSNGYIAGRRRNWGYDSPRVYMGITKSF